jgi:hypothetical protein
VVVEYTRAAKALAGRGFARQPAHTPREHARVLVEKAVPGASSYASLTELYYQARYAGADVDAAVARELANQVRAEIARAR